MEAQIAADFPQIAAERMENGVAGDTDHDRRQSAGNLRQSALPKIFVSIGTILALASCASAMPRGDAERGRGVFVEREQGHCVTCHVVPGVKEAGNLGPPLAGVGSRLTPAQLRVRVADITQVNPDAAMPAFRKLEGLHRVAPAYANRTLLTESQLDDVVAYLAALK